MSGKTRLPRRLRERVANTAGFRYGTRIIGSTACGRATVSGLHLNRPELVAARSLWVQVGWWPPRGEAGG